jgi:hypothetical protein
MKNLPETNHHQLVFWNAEQVTQPVASLSDGQQEQLIAALAELLLLSLENGKGVKDAEQD